MYDGQWELIYPGTDLVLGSSPLLPVNQQRGFHHMKEPDIGDVEIINDDTQRPRSDGISFGQDYRGARLITFELGLRGNSIDDARQLASDLQKAWRGDTLRVTPGGVAALCTSSSGRLRQVYGRPRRCTVAATVPVSAFRLATTDFQTVNDLWYDPTPGGLTVGLAPGTSGGFTVPFTTPLTTTASTQKQDLVLTGGDTVTQPVIIINGPVTNPRIQMGAAWTILLSATINAGESITIDARPWVRSVTRTDGATFAGSLSRTSRLADAVLQPGVPYVVTYSGTDVTGTSTMSIAWNNAYVSN